MSGFRYMRDYSFLEDAVRREGAGARKHFQAAWRLIAIQQPKGGRRRHANRMSAPQILPSRRGPRRTFAAGRRALRPARPASLRRRDRAGSPEVGGLLQSHALPPRSPICNGCVERANAAGRYEFHQFYAGELSVGELNVELAKFERFCNACRPHQALRQTAPMQAYNRNFNQSALAA